MLVLVEVDRPGGHGHPEPPRGAQRHLGRAAPRAREAVVDLDGRDDVGCMVLTGADPAFCAGVDLKALATELRSVQQEPPERAARAPRHAAAARHADHRRHQRRRRSPAASSSPWAATS